MLYICKVSILNTKLSYNSQLVYELCYQSNIYLPSSLSFRYNCLLNYMTISIQLPRYYFTWLIFISICNAFVFVNYANNFTNIIEWSNVDQFIHNDLHPLYWHFTLVTIYLYRLLIMESNNCNFLNNDDFN